MEAWDWMLAAYARPGVADACLALQDEHGQNVPLLLWAAWARSDDPARLARAAETARRWEALAIAPLRQARRALKPAAPPVGDAAREALRAEVQAVELRAERVLVETLSGLVAPERGGASPLASLKAVSAAAGRPAPDAALSALAEALSQDGR